MSLELIERARQLQNDLNRKVRVIPVPELGINGETLMVHVRPITNAELKLILDETNEVHKAAKTIAIRARDADGKLLYKNEKNEIIRTFIPEILFPLAHSINEDLASIGNTEAETIGQDELDAAKN